MNKIFNKRTVLICGLLPSISTKDVTFEQYKAARGLYITDPWERVKSIFSKDDLGNKHPELIHAIQMAELGGIIGCLFGGTIEAIQKSEKFIHTNDVNIYINKRQAYRVLVNYNILSFFMGGVKTAPTFAIFFGGFFLISSCCEAYRNKPEVVDSIMAGTVMGGLSRFMLGVKGMISGGIVGSVLGTLYGVTVWCLTKISKTDQVELKYAQFAMSKYRKQFLDSYKTDNFTEEDDSTFGELYRSYSENKENLLEEPREEDGSAEN